MFTNTICLSSDFFTAQVVTKKRAVATPDVSSLFDVAEDAGMGMGGDSAWA